MRLQGQSLDPRGGCASKAPPERNTTDAHEAHRGVLTPAPLPERRSDRRTRAPSAPGDPGRRPVGPLRRATGGARPSHIGAWAAPGRCGRTNGYPNVACGRPGRTPGSFAPRARRDGPPVAPSGARPARPRRSGRFLVPRRPRHPARPSRASDAGRTRRTCGADGLPEGSGTRSPETPRPPTSPALRTSRERPRAGR